MRRPRIALWIKDHAVETAYASDGYYAWCYWWCPNWIGRWAVRRVDKWHEGLLFAIGQDTSLGKVVEIDRNKSTITVQRMVHR